MAVKDSNGRTAACFLVVENPFKPTTWHLPVKDPDGSVNHNLLGSAWAALHGGYRGSKYDGPGKTEALAKLKALYTAEKMDLPTASMSADEPVVFAAQLEPTDSAPADDIVIRTGKLFEVGQYPDKAFEFDSNDLSNAVAAFEPQPVNLEHTPSVLSGKLGHVARIFAGEDGQSLMGEVHLPRWLDTLLDDGERKVSAEWDRRTKLFKGLALVRDPRVSDAALMAAFSATPEGATQIDAFSSSTDPAAFIATRHDTPSGQAAIQTMHDTAVAGGATCKRLANMASRHEAKAIQQVHDIAVAHGAVCEPSTVQTTNTTAPPTVNGQSSFSRSPRMSNIREWLTGKAQEDGIEFDQSELEAAFTATPPTDLTEIQQTIAARDAEIASLKAAQDVHAAQFAAVATERRQAEAVSFARELVASHKLTPAAGEKLVPLAARIAAADATVTFAEGETSTSALLADFAASLVDLSVFTTGQIQSDAAAALFNTTTTPGLSTKEEADQKRVDAMLAATAYGRAALKERAAAAKS